MPSSSVARAVGPVVRRRAHVGALIAAAITIALVGTGCSTPKSAAGSPDDSIPLSQNQSQTKSQTSQGPGSAEPGSSLVATARGSQVTIRTAPGAGGRSSLKNPTAIGAPLTFLVLEARPGWLKVQLPVRPNGSSGWVAQADVTISTTPYRLVISMSKHQLDVVYEGRRIARHEVGVGKVATPTPKGTYYLTELIQPPNPKGAYGPYAFGLSAFSNTLKSFAGGPGQLGLHGTDAPHGLGKDISHGCIRVANTVITQLAGELPLGTPVDIQA
jgi:lipoprotein-anchoring transpeptidase ErfK/SrfK